MNTFTCFGEVLWDVFPDTEIIGGAPLNVALRLSSFNNNVSIVSAIGNDSLGKRLKNYLLDNNLNINNLQQNSYKTGVVKVTLDTNGSASYDIEAPVAWDYITVTDEAIDKVKTCDMFVFGSLVCRNQASKNALITLLHNTKYGVFDVNLRAPFYSIELLNELMHLADFIKFNDEEINFICNKLKSGYLTIEENMAFISKAYSVEIVCVTLGYKGAVLLKNKTYYKSKGYKIKVEDTVGAGDSFLATLLDNLAKKTDVTTALNTACAVGALVASKKGANPKISKKEILKLINS